MSITISASTLTAGGVSQSFPNKVINFDRAFNNSRNTNITQTGSGTGGTILWTANSFTRYQSDSLIRVEGYLNGYDDWSYPYFGTYVELVVPGGSTLRSYIGSTYQHHNPGSPSDNTADDNQAVNWYVKHAWTPGEIGNTTGSGFEIRYGYSQSSGSGNRPFVVWNYNSSNDSRAFQQGSTSYVWEYAPN